MVYFLNTAWTGRRICLNNSIFVFAKSVFAWDVWQKSKKCKNHLISCLKRTFGVPQNRRQSEAAEWAITDAKMGIFVTPKGGRTRRRPTPTTLPNEPSYSSRAPNLTNLRGSKDSLKLLFLLLLLLLLLTEESLQVENPRDL